MSADSTLKPATFASLSRIESHRTLQVSVSELSESSGPLQRDKPVSLAASVSPRKDPFPTFHRATLWPVLFPLLANL